MNTDQQPNTTPETTTDTQTGDMSPATPETGATTPERSAPDAQPETKKAASQNTTLFIVAAVLLAALAAGYWWYTNQDAASVTEPATSTQPAGAGFTEATEPVAEVNGVEISARSYNQRYQQLSQSYSAQGMSPNDPQAQSLIQEQTIDSLINTEVLLQAAEDAGITADQAAVEAEVDALKAQFPSEEDFQARIEEAGITEAQLREDIEVELVVNEYIDQYVNPEEFIPTTEEIEARYNELVASVPEGSGQEIPPLSEVSDAVAEQLSSEQYTEALQAFIDELEAAADIEITAP